MSPVYIRNKAAKGKVSRTVELIKGEIVVDYDADGNIFGIEILFDSEREGATPDQVKRIPICESGDNGSSGITLLQVCARCGNDHMVAFYEFVNTQLSFRVSCKQCRQTVQGPEGWSKREDRLKFDAAAEWDREQRRILEYKNSGFFKRIWLAIF